jgi:membrane peptidoglycan carboxypeptidase
VLLLFVLVTSAGATFRYADGLAGQPVADLPADSLLYDRGGALIADVHPAGQTRIPVALSSVSPAMRQAIVAVEDRNFWSEGSIDWSRVAAAAAYDVAHHSASQGASTIPEQLAKILYLSDHKTFQRKLNELFLGQLLSERETKQQILADYLNDIPFGHGAIGVEAAARTYFGVPAANLDLAQASLLAGLPNAPADLDPLLHPDAARARQQAVLQAMVAAHQRWPQQAAAAFDEKLTFSDGQADDLNAYPQFTARVEQELAGRLGHDPATAGLSVRTTLDAGLQRSAQAAVQSGVAGYRAQHATDGAAVSIDPATGQVLAYVGSAGPSAPGGQLDMAAQPRQPGSTMKVFTYTDAIAQRKLTMLTPVSDAPLTVQSGGAPFTPHDYDYGDRGSLPAAEALGNSLNIPAVRVELQVGVPSVVQLARSLGVTSLDQAPSSYGPSLTLGGYPVPLWQLAQAYGALAAGGAYHPATFLLSVTDGQGRQLLPAPAAARQALDPGVAYIMNSVLSDDRNRALEFGLGSPLTVPGHQVAAKTGTTNDNRDALTVGWTPHLLTAVWVGNADDSPMDSVVGATGAAPIWHQIMAGALAGTADGWPAAPSDVYRASASGTEGWFLTGTGPSS